MSTTLSEGGKQIRLDKSPIQGEQNVPGPGDAMFGAIETTQVMLLVFLSEVEGCQGQE